MGLDVAHVIDVFVEGFVCLVVSGLTGPFAGPCVCVVINLFCVFLCPCVGGKAPSRDLVFVLFNMMNMVNIAST